MRDFAFIKEAAAEHDVHCDQRGGAFSVAHAGRADITKREL